MTPTLAALIRERFGTVDQLAAEDHDDHDLHVRTARRYTLVTALPDGRPGWGDGLDWLLVPHLAGQPRPWESGPAWLDSMWDAAGAE